MNCLKVFVVLWTCTIVFDTSVNAAVRGDIQAMEAKQKFCGELLDRSIEILCVDMPRRLLFLESQNNENQRNPRDTGKRIKIRGEKHRFLQNHCCVKECSLNFIKSNCPGTRKGDKKENIRVIGNQKISTKAMTTERPRHKTSRFNRKNRTSTTGRPTTTTTTTTVRPTSTTTTTSRTTTEYDDMYYFILFSS